VTAAERPAWRPGDRGEARFWVDDSPGTTPWGAATVGIVDEESGGHILYCHETNAARILDGLRWVANVAL
jgi:hypothetical protein